MPDQNSEQARELNLIADIGGTSARLALARGGVVDDASIRTYHRGEFDGPIGAVRRFIEQSGQSIDGCTACMAIAAPIDRQNIARHPRRPIQFTNSPWSVVPAEIQDTFGLARLIIINDFEAQAYALPKLTNADVIAVGESIVRAEDSNAQERWPSLVVGPGTGLGAALWLSRGHRVICTEGGQIGFAPGDELELEILAKLSRRFGHVAAERLLSGDGLVLLHQCLHDGETLDAAAISAGALAGDDARCAATLARFFAILGSTVGDLTLATGTRGGVYLAGGILPRVADLLKKSQFRERFVDKGSFRTYLGEVPTWLVVASNPGLMGAAAAAQLF